MASLPLPDAPAQRRPSRYADALQDSLVERHHIQVPVMPWPAPPRRLVRISAQLYNDPAQYEALGEALVECLASECRPTV